jgi:DNA-binding MarR family transcriptional regulator
VAARPGFELPLLLLAGFREIVDETHRRLAALGHPEARPAHGFAMQAIGVGATATDVGRRLGVSKQAAAKTIERLVELGYVTQEPDPADARRKIATPTEHGRDMLRRSAALFDDIQAEWAEAIGVAHLDRLRADLARLVGDRAFQIDGLSGLTD